MVLKNKKKQGLHASLCKTNKVVRVPNFCLKKGLYTINMGLPNYFIRKG